MKTKLTTGVTIHEIRNFAIEVDNMNYNLANMIKEYIRDHGGYIALPEDLEDDEREIEHTSMAVMDDADNCVDAYITAVYAEGGNITMEGERCDGQGDTGTAIFDARMNAVDVASWLSVVEKMGYVKSINDED